MPHPIWPFFDLRVHTPRIELCFVDDALATDLALLAGEGVHDPAFMPFAIPWTDVPSPERERNTLQYYWRCRADLTPVDWSLHFAVVVDGTVVGTTSVIAHEFPVLRQFETGSWLGRRYHGQGIGKEMRIASLQLGFEALGGLWATSGAWADNAPSLGVTRSLGYRHQGTRRSVRRGEPGTMLGYELDRATWEATVRRDDIVVDGIEACLPLLGLTPDP